MREKTRNWSNQLGACLLALGLWAGPAGSQPEATAPSEAARLLDAVRERWSARPALEARFTQVQRFAGFEEPVESTGRLRILRPSYFELRFDPPHRQTQVCDGRWVWTYVEEQKQVIRSPLAPDATRSADLLDWTLAGARALSVTPDSSLGLPARSLALQPGEQLPLRALTLWVAAQSPDLLGYEAIDTEGNRTRMRLLEVRAKGGLAPSDFHFTPPSGVEVVVLGGDE